MAPPDTSAPEAATAAPVLTVDGLVKRFGDRTAVDDVSFQIEPGEVLGLLGPNGAGKSTTIKVVCGLLSADGGRAEVMGRPVSASAVESRRHVGYVPQDIALYPDLSARENLSFFGRLYGLRGATLKARIAEVLGLAELTDRAGDRVEDFSGGMKRRLNIAAALLHRPDLLILDEPTVGVDPQSRHAILENVRRLGESGTAVLYTTHYMEEAERICDRIAIIDRGRIVAEGTRRDLVAMISEEDRIELRAEGDLVRFAAGCEEIPGVDRATVSDGHVHLLAKDARGLLPGVIEAAEAAGVTVAAVEVVEPDLEAVFLHLTGTALRD